MKRFLITISLTIVIPLILLVRLYLWTDPFRCIHEFDINDVDETNREYLSTELFLRNNQTYRYNSFIFSSSRGGGMNTYQWKQYLSKGAQPFLFQAWGESLTGIELKLEYLSKHNIPIDNALLLFDIPGTFSKNQLPNAAISVKHYLFTGGSRFSYNARQFSNFIQKPSLWVNSIKNKINGIQFSCESDTISNDWRRGNQFNYTDLPKQDSLFECSEMTKRTFFAKIEHSEGKVTVSVPLISDKFKCQLYQIKTILDEKNTDYHIILTPGFYLTEPAVNEEDFAILKEIFGADRVHNYTGKNEYTEDYNNFSDPGHFGLRVGYLIIEDIYIDK